MYSSIRNSGGNPLAVVLDSRGLTTDPVQSVAAEFNLAETTFILPPKDASHSAEVRIFTPHAEMPFAGHPNIGTAFVVATLDQRASGHHQRVAYSVAGCLVDRVAPIHWAD